LQGLSRTVTDKAGKPHYYAWFNEGKKTKLTLNFEKDAGRFEWT
jgi:hypothetical protein